MWVNGQYFNAELLERIETAARARPEMSRTELSRLVCGWLDWRDPQGGVLDGSCRKALVVLQRQGLLALPSSRILPPPRRATVGQPATVIPEPILDCSLAELGGVELVPVGPRRSGSYETWRQLLEDNHPLGAGPLLGARMGYLAVSERGGAIAALAISAAVLRLRVRDQWIEWSEPARRANIRKVVCNSRFAIARGAHVPNLASHLLARTLRRLPDDWQERYGYSPVLIETFIDPATHAGTCYRAANWIAPGFSAGYEAPGAGGRRRTSPKLVLAYPLSPDCRACLREEPAPIVIGRAHPQGDWAEVEFGRVPIYDSRLKRRLFAVARSFYHHPHAFVPEACGPDPAAVEAAYRLLSNPRVDLQNLLQSHVAATIERVRGHEMVLAVQDTTTLNYGNDRQVEGLGPINNRRNRSGGLILHETLAFTVTGTPLEVLDAQCWARQESELGQADKRAERSIADKESVKWLRSYRAVAALQKHCPKTTMVVVGDRESDVYELFLEAKETEAGPQLLVRSERTRRRLIEEGYLWDWLPTQQVAGHVDIQIPRRGGQAAREAHLEVRYHEVTLRPPKKKLALGPMKAWAVHLKEVDWPAEVREPVEGMLLTTVTVSTFAEAIAAVCWYTQRWGIELFHRVLKSGCRIQDRQLETADRLETALAIDMVVAWRILHLMKAGRETPKLPCTILLEDHEHRALVWKVTRKPPVGEPPSLRDAVRMIARLGGFLARKRDGEPGMITLWRGLVRLADIAECYLLFVPPARDEPAARVNCG